MYGVRMRVPGADVLVTFSVAKMLRGIKPRFCLVALSDRRQTCTPKVPMREQAGWSQASRHVDWLVFGGSSLHSSCRLRPRSRIA